MAFSSVFTNSAPTRAGVARVTRDSISVITTIVRVVWVALIYVAIRVGIQVFPPIHNPSTPAAIQPCCSALADTAIVNAIAFGKVGFR